MLAYDLAFIYKKVYKSVQNAYLTVETKISNKYMISYIRYVRSILLDEIRATFSEL